MSYRYSIVASPSQCEQNALLKLPLRSERATGALAIVNHHSYRFCTLSAASGGDRVGVIILEYLPPRMIAERSIRHQLCRRAHISCADSPSKMVPIHGIFDFNIVASLGSRHNGLHLVTATTVQVPVNSDPVFSIEMIGVECFWNACVSFMINTVRIAPGTRLSLAV